MTDTTGYYYGYGLDTISTGAGDDTITDNGGANTITGGQGDDIINLATSNGNDLFIFNEATYGGLGDGDDIINHFDLSADRLHIISASWGDADLTVANNIDDDAVISYHGGTITLVGIDSALVTGTLFV